jgi:hypothetical protein
MVIKLSARLSNWPCRQANADLEKGLGTRIAVCCCTSYIGTNYAIEKGSKIRGPLPAGRLQVVQRRHVVGHRRRRSE